MIKCTSLQSVTRFNVGYAFYDELFGELKKKLVTFLLNIGKCGVYTLTKKCSTLN